MGVRLSASYSSLARTNPLRISLSPVPTLGGFRIGDRHVDTSGGPAAQTRVRIAVTTAVGPVLVVAEDAAEPVRNMSTTMETGRLRYLSRECGTHADHPGFPSQKSRDSADPNSASFVPRFSTGVCTGSVSAYNSVTVARLATNRVIRNVTRVEWTRGDLNPGPLPCEGSDLPLIYEPSNVHIRGFYLRLVFRSGIGTHHHGRGSSRVVAREMRLS